MARATSSLTAPAAEISSAETPSVRVFASFEYVTFPSIKTAEDPGTFVTRFASNPPVQDSAVANVLQFFLFGRDDVPRQFPLNDLLGCIDSGSRADNANIDLAQARAIP